jgi:P27 family predicted phage terminase small subunit
MGGIFYFEGRCDSRATFAQNKSVETIGFSRCSFAQFNQLNVSSRCKMSNPRTPLKLLELSGSPNLARAKKYSPLSDEKKITAGRPDPPQDLNAEEKQVWEQTADLLEARGTLTEGDAAALEMLARTTVAHRAELKLLEHEGRVTVAPRINRSGLEILVRDVNPRGKIVDHLQKQKLELLKEFGLTPRQRKAIEQAASADEGMSAGARALRDSEEIFRKAN